MNGRLINHLEFISEIDKMKAVYRQTLVSDKSRQETDAEHSWHVSIMAAVRATWRGQ